MKRLFLSVLLLMTCSVFCQAQAPAKPDKPANIIDTLRAAGNFKTLLSALEESGLTETLKGAGPFTIFAPNDAAFSKLSKEVLATLRDRAKLRKLLIYHVAAGKFNIKDLQNLPDNSLTMMNNAQAENLDNGFDFSRSESQNLTVDTVFRPRKSDKRDDHLRNAGPTPKDKIQDNGFAPPIIIINKSARIIVADVSAANGVVHVIDTVLKP